MTQDTRQINLKVVEAGNKPLEAIFGADEEPAAE